MTKIKFPITIILGIILAIILNMAITINDERKPVIESKKTEMKKVPPHLEKKLTEAPRATSFKIPILIYHYVEFVKDTNDTKRQSININPAIFENQVKTLVDAGFTFLTAGELGEIIDGKKQVPKKAVVLTFDDGHPDVLTDILPILEKYHVKGTAYVISGFIDRLDFFSLKQLQNVAMSGFIEIGSHTVHHVSLKNRLDGTYTYEVEQSKKDLEEMIGKPVVSFAYPNGAFDDKAIEVVKNAGYTTAVSTVPGTLVTKDNRFFLFRLHPGRRVGQGFLDFIEKEMGK